MNYLPVNVYTNNSFGDCTNHGVTFTNPNKLVVPCEDGHISEEDVEERGYIVLELRDRPFATATDALKPRGETRWTMAGGNFVYSSDSRFSRAYGGYPLSVHDRIEA
jgi:hypothetical protein